MSKIEVSCKNCGKLFLKYASRKDKSYCSMGCYRLKPKINREKICMVCSKVFVDYRSSVRCCSNKCGAESRRTGTWKDCKYCGNPFRVFKYKLDEGKGIYCSTVCYHKSIKGKYIGENSSNWKGENVGYIGIHVWLHKYFGNPQSCEMCGVLGRKVNNKWNIQWAKLENKEYERKRDNFWGLCVGCHKKYDWDEEKRDNAIKHLRNYMATRSRNKGLKIKA